MIRAVAVLLVVPALLLAGCGGDEDDAGPGPAPSFPGSGAVEVPGSAAPSATAGGGQQEGPPADAAVEDFCAALMSSVADPDGGEVATFAATLARTGTPPELTAEQRQGFELYVGALEALPDDATKEELRARPDLGFTKPQEKKVRAFFSYATVVCDDGSGGPGGTAG